MSEKEPKPSVAAVDATTKPARTRRGRRWLVRMILAVVAIVLVAYAALPYWLPTNWLARRFEDQLSVGLNRQVRIGAIRVGWRQGISIEDITVRERNGQPDDLLARIRRIRSGFTPLFTLRTGRVDHLEIVDPEIWLTFDKDGQLVSLRDLGHRSGGGGFPTWEYHIRQASCHLRMPDLLQTFRIDDLTCSIDKPAGLVTVSGQTIIPRDDPNLSPGETRTAKLQVEGSVVAPQLRKDLQLHGQGRVEWQGLAVTDLPLLVAMKIPIKQVDGVTTGRLNFSVEPHLRADYDLSIRFNSVQILTRDSKQPWQVPDANLLCKGLWDPVRDLLAMDVLDYQTQAVGVHGAGTRQRPALLIDPAGEIPFSVRVTGRVKDWAALCREFPEVKEWTRSAMVRIEGGADLSVDYARRLDEDHLVAEVECRKLGCGIGPLPSEVLCFDPDVPKRLRVDISHNNATGRYVQKEISLSVGGIALTCRGEMTVPHPETLGKWDQLIPVLPTIEYEVSAQVADVGELARLLPAPQGESPVIQGRGPAELKCSLIPRDGLSRLALSLDLPATTQVDVGPGLFRKPAGQALSLSAGLGIPQQLIGDLHHPVLEVTYGPAGLHLASDAAHAGLEAAFLLREPLSPAHADAQEDASPLVDAAWKLPLKVRRVEDLIQLFPHLPAMMSEGQLGLRGNADLAVQGRFISGADDWLIRNEAKLIAGELAAQRPELVNKPADRPLDLVLSHQCHFKAGRLEQSLYASLDQVAGHVSGSLVFSTGAKEDPGDDFEAMTVRADVRDIDRFAGIASPLRDVLACREAVGGLRLEFQSLLADGRMNACLAMDATDAGFTLPGDAQIAKPPGVPARLRLECQQDPTAGTEGTQRWRVTDGSVEIAGLAASGIDGLILVEPGVTLVEPLDSAAGELGRQRRPSRVTAAALQADGQLDLDDPFWQRQPALGAWRDKLKPSGGVKWRLEAAADDGLFALKGRVDAQATGLTFDLGHRDLPVFVKPPEMPASIRFDLTALRPHGSSHMNVEAREIEVDLDGNSLRVSGSTRMESDENGAWIPGQIEGDARIRLTNPTALSGLAPGFPFKLLDGAIFADLSTTVAGNRIEATGEAGFDRVLIAAGPDPIGVDGRIVFEKERIVVDQLQCAWGDSRGTAAGVIHTVPGGHSGRALLGMTFERFDQPQLADLLKRLPFSSPAESRPADDAGEIKRRIVEILRRLDLDMDLRVGEATLTLPMDVRVSGQAGVNRVTVKDGYVNMNFGAVVDGGFVSGSFMTDLKRSEPTIYLNYTASRIQPGPLVDQYLSLTFPAVKAAGPLTLIDETYQKLSPAEGEPNYEVGDGELIIEGGTVGGRAAPKWMTRLFPELDLAKFDFSYMHSWFKKLDDGRTRHQMIFRGQFYNIYMVGENRPGGWMQFEVGIDFLANFDSRYWAESGQGRVPLFTKTGRLVPGGDMEDEEVVYVPQQLVVSLLVKNNPLVTAYHAVRKRVRGEQ